MVQLAKQIVERPTRTFGTNTEMNPKQECKVIFTTRESAEKEKRIEEDVHKEEKRKREIVDSQDVGGKGNKKKSNIKTHIHKFNPQRI